MNDASDPTGSVDLNWTIVGALYLAVFVCIVWMLYWGDYRNAAWLGLLALGGALTAYGRVLEAGAAPDRAVERWTIAAWLVYLVFFVWVGTVFVQAWMGS